MRSFAFVLIAAALATFVNAAPLPGDHLARAETQLPNAGKLPSADPSSLTPASLGHGDTPSTGKGAIAGADSLSQLKSLAGRDGGASIGGGSSALSGLDEVFNNMGHGSGAGKKEVPSTPV